TRIALARPALQIGEALLHVRGFTRTMVLAADDDQVVSGAERLDPNIVIRIVGVPDEDVGYRSLRHARGDCVRSMRTLFGMDRHLVVDRRIGCEDGGSGADRVSPVGRNLD